jgi:NADH-quinone oxidoreductase subunit C
MNASLITDILRRAVPDAAVEAAASTDMPTVFVDREHVLDVGRVLRDDPALQFVFLADVTAVDRLPREPRFELVYHLACLGDSYRPPSRLAPEEALRRPGPPSRPSISEPSATADLPTPAPARRLRVKVRVPGADPRAPSVTSLWPTAGWPEREVFDLFGITFDGHSDLRRILMPDDWEGFPLRKDSPVQIRKETQSWQPIELSAEEFAENIRAQRERATKLSREGRPVNPEP